MFWGAPILKLSERRCPLLADVRHTRSGWTGPSAADEQNSVGVGDAPESGRLPQGPFRRRPKPKARPPCRRPRQATFVKEANITHGPPQVNNGAAPTFEISTHAPARAGETEPAQTELLGKQHGKQMDAEKTGSASGADQRLETLETVHRPTLNRLKGRGVQKRVRGRTPADAA